MKSLLILSLGILITLPCHAQINPKTLRRGMIELKKSKLPQKVEGAFGLKFGAKVDSQLLTNSFGEVEFNFQPTNKFRSLARYIATVSPLTHQIDSITASGEFKSEAECQREIEVLDTALRQKYGEPDPDGIQYIKSETL
jgi:hypothetical protein